MGGGALPPVPDWKSYQVGSHTPELEKVQKMLKSMGLKVGQDKIFMFYFGHIRQAVQLLVPQDPWLRNEVWRFDRRQFGMADRPVLIRRLLSRGVVPGFSLAVVTAGAGKRA